MPKIYVKPAEGLTVPRPDGTPVPAAGDWLEHDLYVRRRLKACDLVEADPPAAEGTAEDRSEEAAGGASSGTDDAKAAEDEAAASPRRRTR